MKKIILLFLLVFNTLSYAQNVEMGAVQYFKITQTKDIKKTGYQLVLKKVLSDYRCPEGVSCVWAGEIKVLVSVYKNQKLVQDEFITISEKHNKANSKWLSEYLPSNHKKIVSIGVFPYPKEGVPINPKDYFIRIGYVK